jgi:predicted Zn-dependent peptidase
MTKHFSSKIFGIVLTMVLFTISSFASYDVKFTEETLDNGMHVIYSIDKSAPVVSTVVHYKVGSRDEDPERTGFAHFFEHLMFEGTKDIERAHIDKYVNEAGGNLNAHTSFDETVYKFTVPSNQIKLALWIESQRMRHLLVDNTGLETQRGVVKEEKKQRYDNSPYGTWFEKMMSYLFNGGSYAWTPIGQAQHIDFASLEEFKAFYNNFYQPNNATLVIAGDFNIDDAKQYVRDYFGHYPKGKEPKRSEFTLKSLDQTYTEEVKDKMAQLPALFMGFRGPKMGEKDYYAMQYANQILATGESSRLYRRLVDQEQTAVQAVSNMMGLEKSGAIMFIGIPSVGTEPDVVQKQILEEVKKMINEGITDEEFEKARNILEASFVNGKKNTLEKAMSLARYHTYYGNADLINTEIEKYMDVKKEDVVNVVKKYLNTDNKVVLTYVPVEAN